jgi:hypothetical protein
LKGANWATWDVTNSLWVARPGIVEQFTLDDLRRGTPSFSLDVDQFEPPAKSDKGICLLSCLLLADSVAEVV